MEVKEYLSIAKVFADLWIRLMVGGELHLAGVTHAIIGDLVSNLRRKMLEEARTKAAAREKPVPPVIPPG